MADALSHPDPELDALIGSVVARGGEIFLTTEIGIWIRCRCNNKQHVSMIRLDPQVPGYKRRKIQQINSFECLKHI